MKNLNLPLIAVLAVLTFGACKSSLKNSEVKSDNSENSLDWSGIYSNVLPCADCEGIQTTIVLNRDNTYTKTWRYLDRDVSSFTASGTFSWDADGRKITLSDIAETPLQYLVGENRLLQLDMEGMEIPTDQQDLYTLTNIDNLVEHHWKLIEVNGNPVPEGMRTEAYLMFKVEDNRLVGSGGCNSLTASYIVRNGNRLEITAPVATKMACLDMEVETQLFRALETTDNYAILGDTLSLNRARMAPLAKFVKTLGR
ncbi:MAG: copper resistance protein NlpE N-terminal domain-containing protein [Bacteroidales bacterium]|jgi:heat shock protein HslJ|nr:copper resistance protein NlpE N-terminal domain-containing protein [Bacteroidales bacterium]